MASFGLVPLEALRRGVPTLEARRVVRNGGEGRNRTNPGKDNSPTTVLKTAEPTRCPSLSMKMTTATVTDKVELVNDYALYRRNHGR